MKKMAGRVALLSGILVLATVAGSLAAGGQGTSATGRSPVDRRAALDWMLYEAAEQDAADMMATIVPESGQDEKKTATGDQGGSGEHHQVQTGRQQVDRK